MSNIKDVLYKGIEEEKKKAIKKYKEFEDMVSEEESIPKLYQIIVEIYKNRAAQRPIAESFLRKALDDDFFKNAKVSTGANEIIFYNERYNVSFPLASAQSVAITDNEIKRIPLVPIDADKEWALGLIKLAEEYLENKSFSNLKELNNYYRPNSKEENAINRMKSYWNTHKTITKERLEELIENVNSEIERANKEKRLVKEHEIKMEESLEFAYSLETLKEWHDSGWSINHYVGEMRLPLDYEVYKEKLLEKEYN